MNTFFYDNEKLNVSLVIRDSGNPTNLMNVGTLEVVNYFAKFQEAKQFSEADGLTRIEAASKAILSSILSTAPYNDTTKLCSAAGTFSNNKCVCNESYVGYYCEIHQNIVNRLLGNFTYYIDSGNTNRALDHHRRKLITAKTYNSLMAYNNTLALLCAIRLYNNTYSNFNILKNNCTKFLLYFKRGDYASLNDIEKIRLILEKVLYPNNSNYNELLPDITYIQKELFAAYYSKTLISQNFSYSTYNYSIFRLSRTTSMLPFSFSIALGQVRGTITLCEANAYTADVLMYNQSNFWYKVRSNGKMTKVPIMELNIYDDSMNNITLIGIDCDSINITFINLPILNPYYITEYKCAFFDFSTNS